MADLWGVEYRRANLVSRYPFDDRATLVASTGATLGTDALIDADVGIPGTPTRVALTAIEVGADAVVLRFGSDAAPRAAAATFRAAAPAATLDVVDAAGVAVGTLVVDPEALATVQAWPAGTHAFPAGAADLAVSAVTPEPGGGVTGVAAPSGYVLSGEAVLVGNRGVTLAVAADGSVVVHAVGDPLGARAACAAAGGAFEPPTPIRTVNGVGPDAAGRFFLGAVGLARGSTILRIEPTGPDELTVSLATGGR